MSQVVHTTRSLFTSDNLSLFVQQWLPEQPRAYVVIAHGLGEHSGRYGNVLDALLPERMAVFALDHRGHGRSDGRRGHVSSFGQFHDDLGLLISIARDEARGLPLYLVGHSLGGLIALSYAVARPDGLNGVVSSGAALRLKVQVPAIKLALGRLTSRIAPQLSMSNGLDPKDLSHDPDVVEAYVADPLVHDRITSRLFTEMVGAMASTIDNAKSLSTPCLVMHGEADPICDPSGSRAFYERVAFGDRKFIGYEGMFHEIFNEIGKERPISDLRGWLTARAGKDSK